VAITESFPPGGDNGHPQRFELDAGDTLSARLVSIVDFLNRGIVFYIMPGGGASVDVSFSVDTALGNKVAAEGSPFTEDTVIHQITPFNGVEIATTGGDCVVVALFPPRQSVAKLERLE